VTTYRPVQSVLMPQYRAMEKLTSLELCAGAGGQALGLDDAADMLAVMVGCKRLNNVSDLPLD